MILCIYRWVTQEGYSHLYDPLNLLLTVFILHQNSLFVEEIA